MTPYRDTPNTLNDEGAHINLRFELLPNNAAEICWNIPDNLDHYNGIIILLDTQPIESKPTNQKFYVGDNTADLDKFVGDTIDTSQVIGTFYDDITTNKLIITDVDGHTNYYVAAFACDNVRNYYTGSYSYQLPLRTSKKGNDTSGYQEVTLNVLESDPITIDHDLYLRIDDVDYTLHITANNYKELVDNINNKIIHLDKTYLGNLPPNTNGLYLDKNLYSFDGIDYYPLECYQSPTAPNNIPANSYWLSNELYQWDNKWNQLPSFKYKKPPEALSCSDFWFDGKTGHYWDNVWKKSKTYLTKDDPAVNKKFKCSSFWFDGIKFYKYKDGCSSNWTVQHVFNSKSDPFMYADGYYWYNDNTLYQLVSKKWVKIDIAINTKPTMGTWYDKISNKVYEISPYIEPKEVPISIITFPFDVTVPGDWYWYSDKLHVWDNDYWKVIDIVESKTDPTVAKITTGSFWFNDTLKRWDGSQWVDIDYFTHPTEPTNIEYWYNTIDNQYYKYDTTWVKLSGYTLTQDPSILQTGQYWLDTQTNTLYIWNGVNWQSVLYSTTSLRPKKDDLWYNTNTNQLFEYSNKWVEIYPRAICELIDGNLRITSTSLGSYSNIWIPEVHDGNLNLFNHTSPKGIYTQPVNGTDSASDVPVYRQDNIVDGSIDERRRLIDNILLRLGYPAIDIELDRSQLELCVDLALASYRKRASSAYDKSIASIFLEPNKTNYLLTDKKLGFDRIIGIMAIYRKNMSFLSSPYGNGAFQTSLLQWLYNPSMGLDLLSYTELQMYNNVSEMVFANKINFRFNEHTRMLSILQNIGLHEAALLDCVVEKPDQILLSGRYSGKWISDMALAEAMMMLAQIRGKYGSVPGPGGSVSLNGGDLQSKAESMMEKLYEEILRYEADEPEKWGNTIVFG
jgi:hypothetical protein